MRSSAAAPLTAGASFSVSIGLGAASVGFGLMGQYFDRLSADPERKDFNNVSIPYVPVIPKFKAEKLVKIDDLVVSSLEDLTSTATQAAYLESQLLTTIERLQGAERQWTQSISSVTNHNYFRLCEEQRRAAERQTQQLINLIAVQENPFTYLSDKLDFLLPNSGSDTSMQLGEEDKIASAATYVRKRSGPAVRRIQQKVGAEVNLPSSRALAQLWATSRKQEWKIVMLDQVSANEQIISNLKVVMTKLRPRGEQWFRLFKGSIV